jgi:hypothetical protein
VEAVCGRRQWLNKSDTHFNKALGGKIGLKLYYFVKNASFLQNHYAVAILVGRQHIEKH